MIYQTKRQFALVGCPLGHSLSQMIHRALGKQKGLDVAYQLAETTAAELPGRYAAELVKLDGFNVTLPHKTAIIPLLDSLSPRAALYGAVNTVCVSGNTTVGDNTDGEGFLRSVSAAGMAIDGRVLIAGCGGAARMFACECLAAGADVTLAVRESSLAKAATLQQELTEKLNGRVSVTTLSGVHGSYDLLINATPVGMQPLTADTPFDHVLVAAAGGVFDAVYNPLKTTLLQAAEAAGIPHLNGLPMLVWQAAASEALWNGVVFTEEEIDHVITLAEKELTGQ